MSDWPVLKIYDSRHLARIALPVGGIGTGTVSVGGRGNLRDWEVMNRPAKGFIPMMGRCGPFFALFAQPASGGGVVCRALEGPLEPFEYEGASGAAVPNHGLPRFRNCTFSAAYPFGQVHLSDPAMPVTARLEAFNPLIPGDADASGIPVALLRYVVTNTSNTVLTASVCGSLPNFVGYGPGNPGSFGRRNSVRHEQSLTGLFMEAVALDRTSEFWGTLALSVLNDNLSVTTRTGWKQDGAWSSALLDFWDDFSVDGTLEERNAGQSADPVGSLAARFTLAPGETRAVTFLLTWHFPNRMTWTPAGDDACCAEQAADRIGNHYANRYRDAWDVAVQTAPRLDRLEARTLSFVRALCDSDLPGVLKEAALFNLSTLRTQTCFRTPDGKLFGWEGCSDDRGCCPGSCTHVWNYEQATPFLFGDLARGMRDVEFEHGADADGRMSFRIGLPLDRGTQQGVAAADGQMGCIVKMYRDWQLSGDDDWLRRLWPKVRKTLEFCWIPGGWDADRDGVMEGCQHNTMDVEYFGPNPQMGVWYLGALRAAEEMARHLGETSFAETCRDLFEKGRAWIDQHLFNGEYYEHAIRLPRHRSEIAQGLRIRGSDRPVPTEPAWQLGTGCLVDQLVGQYAAHVCGLGYLVAPEHVATALKSILKYNRKDEFFSHFNNMRSYALGEEKGLLMASYPKGRLKVPFPYFPEVMTGFEYTAAIGMLFEGMDEQGIACIRNIRDRYDGRRRSPFDEAECGHHYARAMASWAGIQAWTKFHWSAVSGTLTLAARPGTFFWANGTAWGTYTAQPTADGWAIVLEPLHGRIRPRKLILAGAGETSFDNARDLAPGTPLRVTVC